MKEFFKMVFATIVGIFLFSLILGLFAVMSLVGMVASGSSVKSVDDNKHAVTLQQRGLRHRS